MTKPAHTGAPANRWVRRLVERIEALERNAKAQNVPQLKNSSIDNGALAINDINGDTVARVGTQPDGTHGVVVVKGPTPPAPSGVTAEGGQLSITATWSGTFADDAPAPLDFEAIEVHVGEGDGFDVTSANRVGTITAVRGASISSASVAGTRYVRFVTRSKSGELSDPTDAIEVEVASAVDPALFEQLEEDLTAADGRLSQAEDELAEARDLLAEGEIVEGVNLCPIPTFRNGVGSTSVDGLWDRGNSAEHVEASGDWAATAGGMSLKLTPGSGSRDSRAVWTPERGTAASTWGRGKVYTVAATLHLDTPQTDTSNDNCRRIRVYFRDESGATIGDAASPQAPNVPGTYRVSVTFTLPEATRDGWDICLYNGQNSSNPTPVYWDHIRAVEGDAAAVEPYFDGSTSAEPTPDGMQYRWTGAPYASTSEAYRTSAAMTAPVDGARVIPGTIIADKLNVQDVTAAVGAILKLDVSQLVVTGSAAIDTAVISKLFAETFAANKITADELAAGAVTTDKLDANAVTADKLDVGAVTAEKIDADAINGKTITSTNYSPGVEGWIVSGDGTVEFNDGTFRGGLTAQSISGTSLGESSFNNGEINGSTVKSTEITFDSDGGRMLCYTSARNTSTYATSTTVTVPAGVTQVFAEAWGAGGGGHNSSGAGGGGGEYAAEPLLDVTPGETLTITVPDVAPAQTAGGAATVKRGSTVLVQAHGGKAGGAKNTVGGSGSTNTVHFNGGGSSTVATGAGCGGGGGGSAAGPSANGNPGGPNGQAFGKSEKATGGLGGATVGGGSGGDGGTYPSLTASNGGTASGGGGGYYGSNGGTGGRGLVRLTFISSKALAVSVSPTAGVDTLGNHYPAGIATSEIQVARTTTTAFTPGLSGRGAATINIASGYFYTLGDLVFVVCQFTFQTAGSGSTALALTGLPFAPDRTIRQSVSGHAESASSGDNGSIMAVALAGGSGADFDRIRNSGGANMTGSSITAGTLLSFTGWYKRA